jgi:hypothetical protein
MMVTDRQRTALAIAAELRQWQPTVWVLSPLPLADNANLRFQVKNENREEILARLGSWGFSVRPCGEIPRLTYTGMEPAAIFEIVLPAERQAIVDDRTIRRDEVVSAEVKAFRKLHGLAPR